jgi:anaerobic selenocysteine-containing dehydrogenase
MSKHEALSFCRLCMGHCGVVVTLDEEGHVEGVRGDHEDAQTLGYACFKGMAAAEAHNSPERILKPLKRMPDGSFAPIPLQQALDEIAQRLDAIRGTHGVEAIAGYKGGGAFFTASSSKMLNEFITALGSPKVFSSVTIDQSAKAVAAGRIGIWPAGRDPFGRGDVFMIVGANPLVSVSMNGFDTRNPLKRLKQAKARGMRLIVIDPRLSETAKFADVFLQPLPGEDSTILAGMIHIILAEGWQDHEFCARYADDLDALRAAVAPFTPEYVERRADIPAAQLRRAAEVFARDSRRGAASSATGPDMSPNSNLAEHLIETLNVICGRFLREGESVPHPGAILPRWPRKAEVIPAPRWWEQGYRSRIGGFGVIDGELPTGILAEEILEPGPGQVRALVVHGGNPASAIPDQARIVKALRALELLVTIEPFMTQTAQLSHYILPPTLQYERPDLPLFIYENLVNHDPYTRYTPAIARPPAGAEVQDDWSYFWELAQRLGATLQHFGMPLDMQRRPSTDEVLAIGARHAPIDFAQLQAAERGVLLDQQPQRVEPGDPDSPHRFSLTPVDIVQEMAELAGNVDAAGRGKAYSGYRYRFAVRRLRDALNSACKDLPSIRKRLPTNEAFMNPADMQDEGLQPGDIIRVSSDAGHVLVVAAADATLRRGVIAIAHGFGTLPDEEGDPRSDGAQTNRLICSTRDRETINAMPRMSGIPVNISPVRDAGRQAAQPQTVAGL